ncbi:hypothetical protein CN378_19785 [Bacillus sp. AFS015802]|uniref:hypothetical protein n=1 Tax=Bacillus sp. AFS015802 TaxID=2033486 RepID=UPI000BFA4C54|nr:hypothetical protein [Bacillus sp. AFS015802]PFA63259.1 hypothetical protein CN378_19785 [Bacillus sp. AFS015802]
MRKTKFLILGVSMIICLTLLTGCRVILTQEAAEEKPIKPQIVKIDATVNLKSQKIIVRGNTTLPPGTSLELRLKPYSDSATREEIEPYSIDPEDTVMASAGAKVMEDGSIELTVLKRPDPAKRYRLDLLFRPDRQPDDVKLRENIEDSEGFASLQVDGETVTGLLMHVNIFKEDELFGDNITMDFMPKQKTP